MEKSKLVAVFKTLSKDELKDFGRYLEGTAFSKTSRVYALYNYLSKCAPDFEPKKIEKLYVSKKVIKEESSKKILSLMSKLYAVLEDYIIKIQIDKKQDERSFILLEALQERKLDKLFFSKVETIEKEWEQEKRAGVDHLFNEYKLSKMYFRHPNNSLLGITPITQEKVNDKLDHYYLSRKMIDLLSLYSHFNSSEKGGGIPSFTLALIEESQETLRQKEPRIRILGNMSKDYIMGEFNRYDKIFEDFKQNLIMFDQHEQRDLVITLVKYCRENYKAGKTEYLKKIFDLYVFGADHKIILENGIIDSLLFRHIVLIGCGVKELDWVEHFIENYKGYLEGDLKEDTIQLCKAILEFNKKNYAEVLEKLTYVKFKDSIYGIQARCLLLQSYYELEEYEELFFNLVNSLTVYLKRSKDISDAFKEPFANFVKYSNKLQMVRNKPNGNIQSLKETLDKEAFIHSKLWLTEKLQELL